MQTDKKEDENTFFSQIADAVLLHLPEGRMCLVSPRVAIMPPRRPTSYTFYIYTFQFPATVNAGRGQTTAIVKSFRLFRK